MNSKSTVNLHTGNAIPIIGLGTWKLTNNTSGTVEYALDLGYRLIDTSSDYGSQPGIGEALKNTSIPRDEIYITTKVEETDNAYERTKSNLQELGLEYVDLMVIHRPPELGAGEQLWQDLIRAKNEGLIKDIGVSNYSIDLIEQLNQSSGETPVVNQIEWTPFGHSQDMLEYCNMKKIIIQAYSPLTRATKLDNPKLNEIASRYNKTPAQILLRWNIQLGTIPIPKANQKNHLEENLNIFDFEISENDMNILNSLNENYSALGGLPYI